MGVRSFAVVDGRLSPCGGTTATHGDIVREAKSLGGVEYAINRPDQRVDWSFYLVDAPAAIYRCREDGRWYGEDRELGRYLIRGEEVERLDRLIEKAQQ